jgi:hypothetical protein
VASDSTIFFEIIFKKKVCTACSRTSYRIVPLKNLKKYLYNGKSKIKVDINNSSEKFKKMVIAALITAEYAWSFIFIFVVHSSQIV